MTKFKHSLTIVWLIGAFIPAFSARAAPVVYTFRTVTDGQLGHHIFKQAVVVLRMQADTRTVLRQSGANGGLLYTNHVGTTTVSITEGKVTTTATFAPDEVYVQYDAGAGIAGFGSQLGSSYPFALGCDNYAYPSDGQYTQDCTQGDWGPNDPRDDQANAPDGTANILAALAYGSLSAAEYSAGLTTLPQDLTQSTLLTGRVHTCAGTYDIGHDFVNWGDLRACSVRASQGLKTDHGRLFVQDGVGGTQRNGPFFWADWFMSNSGSLRVEVMSDE